jgi:ribonuclease M5
MEKLKIPYTIVVEGKYDRTRVLSVCEARVITTDGFGIFKKNEKLALIRRLAGELPVIILTDSDGAGKLIRSHLTSAIPQDRIIQLYIPQIKGKERRKISPSAEGTLGVEGIEDKILYDLLLPYEDRNRYKRYSENPITKADLYADGLMGRDESAAKRDALCALIGLPLGMTSNALFETLKLIKTYEEYKELVEKI